MELYIPVWVLWSVGFPIGLFLLSSVVVGIIVMRYLLKNDPFKMDWQGREEK